MYWNFLVYTTSIFWIFIMDFSLMPSFPFIPIPDKETLNISINIGWKMVIRSASMRILKSRNLRGNPFSLFHCRKPNILAYKFEYFDINEAGPV